MSDINDLINFAVTQKPNEFSSALNDIFMDKISQAIENKKFEISQNMFNPSDQEIETDNNEEELDA